MFVSVDEKHITEDWSDFTLILVRQLDLYALLLPNM